MPNKIQKLNFLGWPVRVILDDDGPWFLADDVCDILGFVEDQALEMHCKANGVTNCYSIDFAIVGNREPYFINEVNVLRLIDKSRKDIAMRFKHWFVWEVIPNLISELKHRQPMEKGCIDHKELYEYLH